ncbi:MAG TPA: hypothetical protein VFV38_33050 [Ktedonobacteraceae bacterium]|nr:hypothetical protein [Ktedonobacteraceae bacterium]
MILLYIKYFYMSHAVILACPGGYAYNSENVNDMAQAMRSAGAEVTVLGDGEHPIQKENIEQTISSVSHKTNEPVTLLVMGHGDIKEGNHAIDIGGGSKWLTSKELFGMVAKYFDNTPTDVFMTSCHGGAAIPEVDRLPSGSTLVALSPGSETVSGSDVDRIAEHIENGQITASSLATTYLSKALKNRIAPTMAVSGEGVYDYVHKFTEHLGKPFTSHERQRTHQKLDSVMGRERVDQVLDKLSSAKSEWDIYAVDFGPALAVSLAANPIPQALNAYNPQRGSFSSQGDDMTQKVTNFVKRMPQQDRSIERELDQNDITGSNGLGKPGITPFNLFRKRDDRTRG